MKNCILTILLLLSFGAPFAGTYHFIQYQKKKTRKEIKKQIIAGIDKDELVLLKFCKANVNNKLSWKHAKEFEYQGEMYDIVETERSEDTMYYWCWWDHEETKLNSLLKKLVADNIGNNPLNKERQKRFDHYYKSLYFVELFVWLFITQTEAPTNKGYCNNYSSVIISPPVPPPQKLRGKQILEHLILPSP